MQTSGSKDVRAKAQPSARDADEESATSPSAFKYSASSFTASWMQGASAPAAKHAAKQPQQSSSVGTCSKASFPGSPYLGLVSGAQRRGVRPHTQPIAPSAGHSAPLPPAAGRVAPPASQQAPRPWPWSAVPQPAARSAPPGSRMRRLLRMRPRTPQPLRTPPGPLRWRCRWQAAAPGTAAHPAAHPTHVWTSSC